MTDLDFEMLGSAIGSALAKGLDESELRKDQRAREQADLERQKEEAAQIGNALERTIRTFERERETICMTTRAAVREVSTNARANMWESLQKDPRMPRTINYQERYKALVGLQDRSKMLSLLKSTLDLANTLLKEAEHIDVQAAVLDVAEGFRSNICALDGLIVAQPDRRADSPTEESTEQLSVKKEIASLDFGMLMRQTFLRSLGEMSEKERLAMEAYESEKEREEALRKRINCACDAAMQAGDSYRQVLAQEVAGKALVLDDMPAFTKQVGVTPLQDLDLLQQLAVQVDKSFKTFSQVVQDNGLYAAFSSQKDYGNCRRYGYGRYYLDDFYAVFGGGSARSCSEEGIPSSVEEDEGGDSIKRAIERMATFNSMPYDGFLDDDFQVHVDAFWYGFRKLMESANNLVKIDLFELGAYCNDLLNDVIKKVNALAVRMDERQAIQFSKDVAACVGEPKA
ncbi:hypothetical protein [Adlercreutzia aquisgranensis]|uniref:hypothetical protein n=1 Tax=Adlercreutzia aquisgranensis TaxID=2941323 RepID=UPI00203C0613|nr:hypothetical protein [Adlercreutzia aquisgranensis]